MKIRARPHYTVELAIARFVLKCSKTTNNTRGNISIPTHLYSVIDSRFDAIYSYVKYKSMQVAMGHQSYVQYVVVVHHLLFTSVVFLS